MNRRTSVIIMRLLFVAVMAVFLGIGPSLRAQNGGAGQGNGKGNTKLTPGQVKQQARQAARQNAGPQKTGVNVKFAGINPGTAAYSPLATGTISTAVMTTGQVPDYFGMPNYANSPLPVVAANGTITGGMRKFVDTLPGLGIGQANDLGTYIPLAVADTATFGGSDFYRIGLKEYTHRFHSDLPATNVRGYFDMGNAADSANHYLGPLILATRNRPTRILFNNQIATDLNIPVDTTYMGAGSITTGGFPGQPGNLTGNASERRATLHLHGGNTPWISDGTTHQWITPANDPVINKTIGFAKGFSFQNVPDMIAPLGLTNSLTDGLATFYWTNQQSGRLMFYHDHAYGLTRLNVYAGEAAGYLLADPNQETLLKAATVPGTIITDPVSGAIVSADLAHVYPLVIQDKTFVPDVTVQLPAQDPTWDITKWGGFGSLWYPHVYTPNQNPADISGANGFGRWDWGPWFFPPQTPASLVLQGYACPSIATPVGGWAFPPLLCPGVPDPTRPAPSNSPSGVAEGFMDTPLVNGTAYPSLHVAPAAYRFHVLNAANDRTFNLGLYVAAPVTLSAVVTNPGANYTAPVVTVNGCTPVAPALTVTASATVGNGTFGGVAFVNGITGIDIGNAASCVSPSVLIADTAPGAGTGATAVVVMSNNTDVRMVPAVPAASRPATMPNCSLAPTMGGGGLVTGLLDTLGNPLNGTGLPTGGTSLTACWPVYNSTYGFTAGPMGEKGVVSWGNSDGRNGGVPDPTTAGPPIIQIGTEGGLLPQAAVIPSTPVSYDYNKRSITVLNILNHGLLMGPAERADIVVDFSAFAGKTLILYNDAPAPVPGADPRLDTYTNDVDYSSTGGAPSTIAGYGPNIRTVMQIVVDQVNPNATTFSLPALMSATTGLPAIFSATQDSVIVPEAAYPAANGFGPNAYARIQDTSLAMWSNGPIGGLVLTNPGAGYTVAPSVIFNPTGAVATANLTPTSVASIVGGGGTGYTTAPTVTIAAPVTGTRATATATLATTGFVKSVTITNGGAGYTAPPIVGFTNCTTAPIATATVPTTGPNRGKVTAVVVTSAGAGCSAVAPLTAVTFTGTSTTPASASAVIGRTVASVALTTTPSGSGYTVAPGVSFSGGGGTGAAATTTLTPTSVAGFTVTNFGTAYTAAPIVTVGAPTVCLVAATCNATAVATAPVVPMLPKAIQELFTLDYGRMNATLGVELPLVNFTIQTTIPYGYNDPPTEIFKDGETQIWKITHNGVDTHFMHFHLFTVQVINRVGWDGAIKPPDPNELSFKDTVRMNPLEDIIVALRPFKQSVSFAVPSSSRPLDTTHPVGYSSTIDFTNVDPTNQPATVVNQMMNFGWEYVWHCHILGHEENDMMRAMILAVAPPAPTVTAVPGAKRGQIALTLSDSANLTNPVPTGFTIYRSTTGAAGSFVAVGSVTAIVTGTSATASFVDTGLNSGTTYFYQAIANNLVGYVRAYAAPAVGYPNVSADSPVSVNASAIAR